MKIGKLVDGNAYTIHDINFSSNAAVLETASMVVLEEFAAYLKEHPTMKIEIHGHTDDVGESIKNLNLSNERAFAVFEALINYGVSKNVILNSKVMVNQCLLLVMILMLKERKSQD